MLRPLLHHPKQPRVKRFVPLSGDIQQCAVRACPHETHPIVRLGKDDRGWIARGSHVASTTQLGRRIKGRLLG